MHEKTKAECRQIFISELVTAGVCAYLIYTIGIGGETPIDLRLIVPGAILILTLLQGCGYWAYRFQLLNGVNFRTASVLKVFALLKKIMPPVFGIYPLFLVVMLFLDTPSVFSLTTFFCLIMWLFAIVEYINLYRVCVNFRDFRKPSDLSLELGAFSEKGGLS